MDELQLSDCSRTKQRNERKGVDRLTFLLLEIVYFGIKESIMKQEYQIRIARKEDCADMAEIYAPYVANTAVSFEETPPDADEIWTRVLKSLKKHVWLVCVCDRKVVGYAYARVHRERKAYQWVTEVSVYIHEHHRKLGIATALYNALHAVLRKQGYIQAYAGMTLPNLASKGFHENLGYVQFATYKNAGFKLGEWRDTAWWSLALTELPEVPGELKSVESLDETWLEQTFAEFAEDIGVRACGL